MVLHHTQAGRVYRVQRDCQRPELRWTGRAWAWRLVDPRGAVLVRWNLPGLGCGS
jgi:hypothetical protein